MKKDNGFTLIELMVALTVFAILVAVGIPQINHLTNSNRMVSEINTISGSLALARSESVKRGRIITICGSTDNATCDTSSWEAGWIAFMDVDKDNVVDTGDGDVLLKVGPALTAGNTLRLLKSDNSGVLQFKPDGTLRDRNFDGSDDGTFVLCEKTKDLTLSRGVHINRLGRTSRAEDTDATPDNIINDIEDVDITCPA